ncbi:riboflavin synthase [Legionella sp. km772]|uniref:riboflavin synthase n=1 Tax=Legionella sp. km772 TaxID=2498111 RepID=UPI000F8D2956|nr:riboflavin synthase [Legionella sp. km772]RUR10844.1 riboflavin synthase [Legionella sp. km772]
MFTGLIETTGQVITNQSNGLANRLIISTTLNSLTIGESIAVNGVCLTLLPAEAPNLLYFDVSPETLKLTTLGSLQQGQVVNLERAMLASARFGGHYVSGHVDTTAKVHSFKTVGDYVQLELSGFEKQAGLYLITKGSITVEGVSLTINAVMEQKIQLMLVPHTLLNTSLNVLEVGQRVNIEFDYFTRIVAHQLQLFGKLDDEVKA